jgi:hypothetical protein
MDTQRIREQLQVVDTMLTELLEAIDGAIYATTTVEDSSREVTPENSELSEM